MPELTPQAELFLRIAAGLVLVPLVWGLLSMLLDLEVQAEEDDEIYGAVYYDLSDVRERFGQR